MSGRSGTRRTEAVVAATVAIAVLLLVVVALDALRFHLPALIRGERIEVDAHTVVLGAFLALEALVLLRVAGSLRRRLAAHRRLGRLDVLAIHQVGAHRVRIVGGSRPAAFCAGLIRPQVYITECAVARLARDELRAVVEHEAAHARRGDPLRLAIAGVTADALGFIPALRGLARAQANVADLVADRATIAIVGAPPLASAMLQLQEPVPERVDHLLRRVSPGPRHASYAASFVLLLSLLVLAGALAVIPHDAGLPLTLAVVLSLPALLVSQAARR
jgi:Zn-dependent protease with chaperone function